MPQFGNASFTAPNGTALTAVVAESGGTFVKHLSATNSAVPTIEGNAVRAAENNSEAWYYLTDDPAGANYTATTRYSVLAVSNGNTAGAGVRHATGAATGYQFFFNSNFGTPFFRLRKVVAGTGTSLIADMTSAGLGVGTYDLTCSAVGSTISGFVQRLSDSFWLTSAGAWQAGQVACMTATDTAITAAGKSAAMFGRRNASEEETLQFRADDAVAGPILTGDITTDAAAPTGQLGSAIPSSLTGNITTAEAAPTGTLGAVLSTVTTLPFSRNPGLGARPVSLPNIALAVLTDDADLTRLAGSSALLMGSDGRLQLANGVPAPAGTSVIVVTREPGAGGALGVERYTLT